MVYFDNAGDPARAVANAEAAIAAHVDLLIEYNADADANAEIARRLVAAGIPALALVDPVPGAPLYGPDNRAAGRIAGRALGAFARDTWPDEQVLGVLIGDLADPGPAVSDRVQGITEGVHESLPTLKLASLDTGGQSVRADALLAKFLQTQRGQRLLIATLDDLAAVYARNAIEMNRRQSDCIIVSQGLDRNIHGGASEKKETRSQQPRQRGARLGRLLHGPLRLRRAAARLASACRRDAAAAHGDTAYPGHRRQRVPGISAVRYELTSRGQLDGKRLRWHVPHPTAARGGP